MAVFYSHLISPVLNYYGPEREGGTNGIIARQNLAGQ